MKYPVLVVATYSYDRQIAVSTSVVNCELLHHAVQVVKRTNENKSPTNGLSLSAASLTQDEVNPNGV